MQVSAGIKVLSGASRSAVYDLNRGICWPASEDELNILQSLAIGRKPEGTTRQLVEMRRKGWISPGSPRNYCLDIERLNSYSEPKTLEHVWLEVTNSCNLKCSHCYASSGPDVDRSAELSSPEWLKIVDDILSFGVNKLTFIGGEPTIRLDLVEEISSHVRASRKDVTLRMFSNLSIQRIRSKTLDVVEKYEIEFGTALYGMNENTHDEMTGRNGSWLATIRSIQLCLERNVDIFVGMYLNMSDLAGVAQHEEWLRELGVKRFQVLAPSQVGRGAAVSWKDTPLTNRLPGIFYFSEHQWNTGRVGHNCYHDHIAIMPGGNVSPCIMTREVSYGNVAKTQIAEILKSSAYKSMSNLSKDNIPGCRECEFRYACFDCRPDAMQGSDNYLRKPDCGYDPKLQLGDLLGRSN